MHAIRTAEREAVGSMEHAAPSASVELILNEGGERWRDRRVSAFIHVDIPPVEVLSSRRSVRLKHRQEIDERDTFRAEEVGHGPMGAFEIPRRKLHLEEPERALEGVGCDQLPGRQERHGEASPTLLNDGAELLDEPQW